MHQEFQEQLAKTPPSQRLGLIWHAGYLMLLGTCLALFVIWGLLIYREWRDTQSQLEQSQITLQVSLQDFIEGVAEQSDKLAVELSAIQKQIDQIPASSIKLDLEDKIRRASSLNNFMLDDIMNTLQRERSFKAKQSHLDTWHIGLLLDFLYPHALAADTPEAQSQTKYSLSESMRIYLLTAAFAILSVFFFGSAGAIFVSTNARVISFALDAVKMLLGFFIGVFTNFAGMK